MQLCIVHSCMLPAGDCALLCRRHLRMMPLGLLRDFMAAYSRASYSDRELQNFRKMRKQVLRLLAEREAVQLRSQLMNVKQRAAVDRVREQREKKDENPS